MDKEDFEKYLIAKENKTENTAYNYVIAIPHLSEHYSNQIGEKVNFFEANETIIQKATKTYRLDGENASFGNKGNGTYRNAMNALLRMKKNKSTSSTKIDYLINEVILSDYIQKLINNNQFQFQKLLDVKDKFLNYNISEKIVEQKIKDYEDYNEGTFEDFVLQTNDSSREFLELVAEYISYLDKNASGKNRWNKYEDKRTLALAFVRMPYWVNALLKLKINPDEELTGSVKNAIQYSFNPMNNLTVLSENHRQVLSNFLLEEEYDEVSFQNNLIKYFSSFNILPKNKMNYTYIISSILYDDRIMSLWNPRTKKGDEIKYWKVGSNDGETSYLNEMLLKKYISIGWNDIGNLNHQSIENKKDIITLLEKSEAMFRNNSVKSRKAGEIYNFYSGASEGDIVCLMDGISVKAIGKIISDYDYDDTNTKPFAHFRATEWLKTDLGSLTISDGLNTSFYPLTKKNTIKKIKDILSTNESSSDINTNDSMSSKSYPLNQILYGPPGTGKTYLTKKLAVEIIENKTYSDSSEDRELINKAYRKYLDLGLVTFSTFHQSISYEDFIEGIKPVLNDDEESDINYEIQDGIFKVICSKAKKKKKLSTQEISEDDLDEFDSAWSHLTDEIQEKTNNSEVFTIPTKTNKEMKISGISDKGNLYLKPEGGIEKEYTVSFKRAKKLFKAYPELDKVDNIDKRFREIIGGSNSTAYWSVLNYLHNWAKNNIDKVINDELESVPSDNLNNFVFIIDEINRGNISSIFGELITLLEQDKRLGQDEEIKLKLPYSKDEFGVPDNVYVIGTMNTADRSVEALDTALRRRFSFFEVNPNTDVLKRVHTNQGRIGGNQEEIDLTKLLDKINDRIEILLDKNHKIGHSYFIKVKYFVDLVETFKDKVIPLLEEYFYGDFGKIGLVLGKAFIDITKKENKTNFAHFDHEDKEIFKEKTLYHFTQPKYWTPKSFQSIYETSIKVDE